MSYSIENTKLYLGPMSKNIVDAIISFVKESGISIGLIASRRQIDQLSGYVNNWTTRAFVNYVKEKDRNILVCRDHGGVGQGRQDDDGIDSLLSDSMHMDVVHIDPWKKLTTSDAIKYTIDMIEMCLVYNENCRFEVGTEEAIKPMTPDELDHLLNSIKKAVPQKFDRIVYAVIQSGTALKSGTNTGNYNQKRLEQMIEVCSRHGVLSKEHNGDYLSPTQIKDKFALNLSAINIAPEVAHIETECILEKLSESQTEQWFDLCIKDGQWKKWFPANFNPNLNKKAVLKLCGHYVLSSEEFSKIFNLNTISTDVCNNVHRFIKERI